MRAEIIEALELGLTYLVAYKKNEGVEDNGAEVKIRRALAWSREHEPEGCSSEDCWICGPV